MYCSLSCSIKGYSGLCTLEISYSNPLHFLENGDTCNSTLSHRKCHVYFTICLTANDTWANLLIILFDLSLICRLHNETYSIMYCLNFLIVLLTLPELDSSRLWLDKIVWLYKIDTITHHCMHFTSLTSSRWGFSSSETSLTWSNWCGPLWYHLL